MCIEYHCFAIHISICYFMYTLLVSLSAVSRKSFIELHPGRTPRTGLTALEAENDSKNMTTVGEIIGV